MTESDSDANMAAEVHGHRKMVVALTKHLIVHLTALSPVPQPPPTPPVAMPLILKLEHLDLMTALMMGGAPDGQHYTVGTTACVSFQVLTAE